MSVSLDVLEAVLLAIARGGWRVVRDVPVDARTDREELL